MKIIVIGASGTIGRAVVEVLKPRHEILCASRQGDLRVNIEDAASIAAMYDAVPELDAVVCAAGTAKFGRLSELTERDFIDAWKTRFMAQVNVVRLGIDRLRDGGSFTLTSGSLARQPVQGSTATAPMNAAIEAFVRAAALELPRRLRVNVVSPGWVRETLEQLGRDGTQGLPAARVARAYAAAVESPGTGKILDPAAT